MSWNGEFWLGADIGMVSRRESAMKACVATGEKRRVECRDIPMPVLEPGMPLLKTIYACICGSDLEYLDTSFTLFAHGGVRPGAILGHQFVAEAGLQESVSRGIRSGAILGHEFVAEVADIGEGVEGWEVGDRAVPLAGRPTPQRPAVRDYETYGCMAEYFVSSPLTVQKVLGHVSDEEAVFVEPLGTGYGSVEASGVRPGQSAAIIGAGKIGLLAMMAARVSGAAPVIAVDAVRSRLDKALELGADAAFNAREVDIVSEIVKLTIDGPNAVIICVRDGAVLNQAVEMSRRGSTIVLAGFVPPMEVNPMLWTTKQLKIIGVLGGQAGTPDVMTTSMHMISHKQIDPRPLISEIIPPEDIQRGIDSVYSGENIAVLIKP